MLDASRYDDEEVLGGIVRAVDAAARGIAGRLRDRRNAREQRLGSFAEGRRLAQDSDRVVRGSCAERSLHQLAGACESGSAFTWPIGAFSPRSLRMSSVHFDSITSGRCVMRSARMARKPPSFSCTLAPEAMRRARPSCTRREAVGSQITAASSLPARKLEVITSMFWFRYSLGLMPSFLKVAWA